MERRVPAVLWVTLIGGVLFSIGWWVLVHAHTGYGAMRGLSTASQAGGLAWSTMIVVSMMAMREVTTRAPLRAALLVVAIVFAIVHAVTIAVFVWMSTGSPHPFGYDGAFLRGLAWAGQLTRIAAFVALGAIGVRFDRVMTIVGFVVLLAIAVLREASPSLVGVGSTSFYLSLGLAIPSGAVVIALARLGVAGAGLGWQPARRGLERAATAMGWRIGLGVAVVPLLFLAIEMRSMGLIKAVLIGVPLASALAGALSLIGLITASRADASGAPRLRLATAGYTTALGAGLDLLTSITLWRQLGGDDLSDLAAGFSGALRYVLPAISLLGTLAFVSALDAITTAVPTGVERGRLVTVGMVMCAVTGVALWLPHAIGGEISPPTVIVISLALSVAAIIATLSLVSMTRQIAAALGGAPAVPAAIAREAS